MDIHPAEVRRKLEDFVAECGTQALAAESLGVCQQYLSKIMRGERAIARSILAQMGIQRVVVYRTVK